MSQCHEEEKYEDELLNLRDTLLTITGKGLHTEVRWEQYLVEVEDADEFCVVRFLEVTTDRASGSNYKTKRIRYKERAPEVLISSISWRNDLP